MLIASIALTSCASVPISDFKSEIENACPAGTHYSQVIAFLDAKGIQLLYQSDRQRPIISGNFLAKMPQAKKRLFRTWSIYLAFDFDREGRLTKYYLWESADFG